MAMLSHRQGWSRAVAASVFSFILIAIHESHAQPTVTYRASTSEVRVSFFVTDEKNRLIENLQKDDFAIVDSGVVIRDFRSLTRSNETAIHLMALVDASESAAPGFAEAMNDVAQLASQQPSRQPSTGDDDFSVLTFSGDRPNVLCAGDCRTAALQPRLLAVKASGTTSLYDAMRCATGLMARRRVAGVRDVIILFSDGEDNYSKISATDALDAMVARGVLLYTVDLHPSVVSSGSAMLERLAEGTGGRSFTVQEATPDLLQAILADLRASYVVTYSLPNRTVGFHSLRIFPKHNQSLRFHCRRGYSYEKEQ
jgi:VWFA-related protein